ncbi:rhamnogalacturonan lyase [Streptomyces sp. DH24]|uniref:rhamnogalacturonan lyase n=1 Tax=Streptomyces sp. DH24 TaxID=3040123 RepID=UPI0024418E72|nr:rhamnogalacturonan lyase [Streptomyces sp. DH24]MDG9719989.1 rhamnogalacturonan lyase [Streptomyces sp. DH24]
MGTSPARRPVRRGSAAAGAVAAALAACAAGLTGPAMADTGEGTDTATAAAKATRAMEKLDRAPVAVKSDDGVFVGWRLLGLDPPGLAFHVVRDGERITDRPLTGATSFTDPDGTADSEYRIEEVRRGKVTSRTDTFGVQAHPYKDIPVDRPEGGTTPDGKPYTYHLNDSSVGDLNGDGQYEIVQKWYPSNAQDNSRSGYTGNTIIDAYTMDGERLWRIDLGRNIRSGAHYTQFMVYDLDGDGRAEVVMKTADGTVDGKGETIGDADADHRNAQGYVLKGPEYLTVFDGRTGAARHTVDYTPPRGDLCAWGDCYGNRGDRFLAGVAYLDGKTPSVVFARGYYTRSVLAAYDYADGKLRKRWVFDSNEAGAKWAGQGNHQLSVADVDADGKDEIVYGSMTVDDDGTGLYSTGLGHGDAQHLSDLDPSRDGLEVFSSHESMSASGNAGGTFRDARTGEVLWSMPAQRDTGRGAAGDIDPAHPGAESWAVTATGAWDSREGELRAADGTLISTAIPSANHMIWWDGDPLREILNHEYDEDNPPQGGAPYIAEWNPEKQREDKILTPAGVYSNNGTKGNPSLQADLLGDWREEVVFRTSDESALRIFTTTAETGRRLPTLMHDPVYRLGVAWQNVGYNQPPWTSYFIGKDMRQPARGAIHYAGE